MKNISTSINNNDNDNNNNNYYYYYYYYYCHGSYLYGRYEFVQPADARRLVNGQSHVTTTNLSRIQIEDNLSLMRLRSQRAKVLHT